VATEPQVAAVHRSGPDALRESSPLKLAD